MATSHPSSAARAAARKTSPARIPPVARAKGCAADPGDGFAIGADVVHPRFGGGRILDREGQGKHLKLTIHFLEHGPKKILPAYTTLRMRAG